ncbi:TPA: KilA-N domain-containing protein [Citrobacter freundii]
MQTIAKSTLPVIAGVEIITDDAGRFNLNSLHKASGGEKKKGPSYWLALEGTKALIDELSNSLTDTDISVSVLKVIKGGTEQGTFAHELLAIEYAGWISPVFRLQVNQTFIDYRSGKLLPVTPVALVLPGADSGMRDFRLARADKLKAEALKIKADTFDQSLRSIQMLREMFPGLDPASQQAMAAAIINPIIGQNAVPLPALEERLYSATDVADKCGVSANKVGRLASKHNLRVAEFGKFFLDQAKGSAKQVTTFRYNDRGLMKIRTLLAQEVLA